MIIPSKLQRTDLDYILKENKEEQISQCRKIILILFEFYSYLCRFRKEPTSWFSLSKFQNLLHTNDSEMLFDLIHDKKLKMINCEIIIENNTYSPSNLYVSSSSDSNLIFCYGVPGIPRTSIKLAKDEINFLSTEEKEKFSRTLSSLQTFIVQSFLQSFDSIFP